MSKPTKDTQEGASAPPDDDNKVEYKAGNGEVLTVALLADIRTLLKDVLKQLHHLEETIANG